jgi:hypothetical protein
MMDVFGSMVCFGSGWLIVEFVRSYSVYMRSTEKCNQLHNPVRVNACNMPNTHVAEGNLTRYDMNRGYLAVLARFNVTKFGKSEFNGAFTVVQPVQMRQLTSNTCISTYDSTCYMPIGRTVYMY